MASRVSKQDVIVSIGGSKEDAREDRDVGASTFGIDGPSRPGYPGSTTSVAV